MFEDRPKAGDLGGVGHEEQIPYIRQSFERRGSRSERTLLGDC